MNLKKLSTLHNRDTAKIVDKSNFQIISGLKLARVMARAWAETVVDRQRQQAAWAFIKVTIDEYVKVRSLHAGSNCIVHAPAIALTYQLDSNVFELARNVGSEASLLTIEEACYQICSTYTALVPQRLRSSFGMFYTPPALAGRLIDLTSSAEVNWKSARVLDPACGGGAFLLPVALKMRDSLKDLSASDLLDSITSRLTGFEIDPFAAWLTQTWLEIALSDLMTITGRRLPQLVKVCDSLDQEPTGEPFDLVIGNPPYGRVSLTPEQRARFSRSLFGHANLYGLFTDLALRWTGSNGVISYVSPTSFLAGEYFKNLRALIAVNAPPTAIDFIESRKGVFEDVLQETLLATYKRGCRSIGTSVHYLEIAHDQTIEITRAGQLVLPSNAEMPWFVPRVPEHQKLIERLAKMPTRLSHWGYQVSTGPLVWNRYKQQLSSSLSKDTFPLIWAESVSLGKFTHRADKRNHQPYFKIVDSADSWLKVDVPCVLVQRTTAKEQNRRLIAAELPSSFIKKYGAVVVENHLNMVRPVFGKKPSISAITLSAILNSKIVDTAFRCMSGSVAVSAFELESLPLPSIVQMKCIEDVVKSRASDEVIEAAIAVAYFQEMLT
jgi:adenine-specific DNA-methyltransferase